MFTPSCRPLFGLAFVAILGLLPSLASATQYTFNPNPYHEWNDSDNWLPHGIPGANDDVIIGTYVSTGNQTFKSLTITGGNVSMGNLSVTTLTISGGSLTTSACSTTTLNQSAGAIGTTSLDIAAGGTWTWTSGSASGSPITIPATATLSISGGEVNLGTLTILNNSGTTTISGGPIVGYDRSTFNNLSGGTCVISTALPFKNYFSQNVFNNDGLLETTGDVTASLWTLYLNGETRCSSGNLTLTSAVHIPAGSTFTGAGTTRLKGNVHITGPANASSTNLTMEAGNITGTAPGGFIGTLAWMGGSINGTLDVPAGSFIEVSEAPDHYLAGLAVLNVNGTLRWLGGSPIRGYDRSVINILPGGLFDIAADGDLLEQYFSQNRINLQGRMVKSTGSGATDARLWLIHSSGQIECNTGTLNLLGTTYLENDCVFSGGGTTKLGGATSLDGNTTATLQTHITSGTFTGNGGSLSGDIRWKGGDFYGTTVVGPAGRMVVDGTDAKIMKTLAVLQVAGVLDFNEGSVQGWDRSRMEVLAGGRFNANASTDLTPYYSNNTLNIQAGGVLDANNGSILNLTGWAIDNDGTLTVKTGGQLSCNLGGSSSGSFVSETGGILTFADGTQSLNAGGSTSGPGEVRVVGTLVANDAAVSGKVDLQGGRVGSTGENGSFQIKDTSTWDTGSLFENTTLGAGDTFRVVGDTGVRDLEGHATLTSHGIIRWEGEGSIRGIDQSNLVNESTGRIEFHRDGVPFSNYFSGNTLTNRGTIQKAAGSGETTLNSWTYLNEGNITVSTGVLAVDSNLSLNPGGQIEGPGRLMLRAGRSSLDGTTTVSGGTLELAGAEIYGNENESATLAGSSIEWTAGGTTNIVTLAGTVATSGAGIKDINKLSELRISGSLIHAGSGVIRGIDRSVLKVLPGGLLHLTGTAPISQYFGGNSMVNEGTLQIGNPPATINLPWIFTQTSSGTLEIGITGADSITPEFGRLLIAGSASLAGTVRPILSGGYIPTVGTGFQILSAANLSGTTFDSVSSDRFTDVYGPTTVNLQAIEVPYTYTTWAEDHGLTGNDAATDANPDHDAYTNFEEYAFNLDPNVSDTLDNTPEVVDIDGVKWLSLPYRVWTNRTNADLYYQVVSSSDLKTWDDIDVVDEIDPDAPLVAGSEGRRGRVPITASTNFLRLRAFIAPPS